MSRCLHCLLVSLTLSSCVLLLRQKLSLLELRHTVQSLRSSEARLLSQKALLDAKMAAAVASPPPPAFQALQYEDDTRSIGSAVSRAVSELQLLMFRFWKRVGAFCFSLQDKTKEKSSRFDTLRHSLAGMIRAPKAMVGSSTSVRSLLVQLLQKTSRTLVPDQSSDGD